MFQKIFIFLLAIVVPILAAQPSSNPTEMTDDLKLMELMLKQSRSGENLECFGVYLPILQEVDTQYRIDYTKCWNDRQAGANGIENRYTESRQNLTSSAKNICRPLLKCDRRQSDSQTVFECYEKVGAEKLTPLNNLSLDGGQLAREIAEDFRRIDIIAEACYAQAYRTYSNDRNDAQSRLEDCLENGLSEADGKPLVSF